MEQNPNRSLKKIHMERLRKCKDPKIERADLFCIHAKLTIPLMRFRLRNARRKSRVRKCNLKPQEAESAARTTMHINHLEKVRLDEHPIPPAVWCIARASRGAREEGEEADVRFLNTYVFRTRTFSKRERFLNASVF